jgi:hypothetical protein
MNKRPRNEEGGELVVVGNDKVRIKLQALPHRIEVHFKKKNDPPPCDPHHHHHHSDRLEWEVKYNRGHNEYTLTIKWKVHDVREIFWTVYYC